MRAKRLFVASVTGLRIILAVVIIAAALRGLWLIAIILTLLAFISDFVDGWLARRLHATTAFGAFFDPLADKIVCLSVLALLALYATPIYWVLFGIFATYDICMTLLRLTLANSRSLPASRTAKLKTALLMSGLVAGLVSIAVHDMWWLAATWALLVGAAILTAVAFFGYLRALGRSLSWLEHPAGVASIDFARWHADGITSVLFDIEGTLAPWNTARVDAAVVQVLEQAKANGIARIGLVTNMSPSREAHIQAIAQQIGAQTYHFPISRRERKPSPAMVRAATGQLGVSVNEAAFVGDKLVDVIASHRAGIRRIAWVDRLGIADHLLDRAFYRPLERLIKLLLK